MDLPFFLVDAFAETPFTGNPAGVCLLEGPAPEDWMQKVAMEMNQAETAFLYPLDGAFSLRWFTPSAEVDLCGHATLASAKILWHTGALPQSKEAIFHTKSGELRCMEQDGRIVMDFPSEPPSAVALPEHVLAAFEAHAVWTGKNRMDVLIEVLNEQEVLDLKVDLQALASYETRGFIITAKGSGDYDFVSRFFAPAVAVPEDPVTGSAHCCLAPYWAEKLGKTKLTGYQASKRGGVVGVEVVGDRVMLSGSAQVVVEGKLRACFD